MVFRCVRRAYNVVLGWYSHRITRIVGQYLDVFLSVTKVTCVDSCMYSIDQEDVHTHQEGLQVIRIIDTTTQLPALVEIVDANLRDFISYIEDEESVDRTRRALFFPLHWEYWKNCC